MELVAVAAVADNNVIGNDGDLPWHLPADKRQYRDRVADAPVILGRRTYESMRHHLPGAIQIVLTRHPPPTPSPDDPATVRYATTPAEAIRIVESLDGPRAYILGGAQTYAAFLPHLDRMIITRVPGAYDGDTHFPDWDEPDWTLAHETPYPSFTVQEWTRTP